MNKENKEIFQKYVLILEKENINEGKSMGQLIGAKGGGEGGTWGGSLPKLISLLPFGVWKPTSLKRPRQSTRSGFMSDHYEGNSIAYAADFGLNTTFGSRKDDATKFAIAVARNAGANVSSWEPFKGNSFKYNTSDGYRIQVIWLSNVGGNHYDHVHVGVKKGAGAVTYRGQEDAVQNSDVDIQSKAKSTNNQEKEESNPAMSYFKSLTEPLMSDFSKQGAMKTLQNVLGTAKSAIENKTGKKLF
jgi:hypothetical protein